MSTFTPTTDRRPSRAAAALYGRIVLPEHGAWDAARQAWNLAVDQRPAAVGFPESAQDVAAALRFAGDRGRQRGTARVARAH